VEGGSVTADEGGRAIGLFEPLLCFTPDPVPLPGDLRVVRLIGPEVRPSHVGSWQIQRYEARTGGWRAFISPAPGAEWRTFATEAAALEHLFGHLRRHQQEHAP
jgi:hypothetical protein